MTRFVMLPELRFTCTECGDCCVGWNVVLEDGEGERIAAAELGPESPAPGSARTVRMPDGRLRLARRDDDACVFLGQRRQCLLHERAGAEAKPRACRWYPFSFTPLGEAIGVDVAFSCRAVSEGQGSPVGERVTEWEADFAFPGELAGAADAVRLAGRRTASPAVGWELEHALCGFLRDADIPMVDRLRTGLDYTRLAVAGDAGTPQAALLRAALARALPGQIARARPEVELDRTQRAVFRTLLYLALNPPPADLPEWPRARRAREAERRDAQAAAFRDDIGRPWIDNRERAVSSAALAAVGAGILGRRDPGRLGSFLAAKILGQRFRRAGASELSLLEAVPRLLLLAPMAAWTARALAAESAATEVDGRHLAAAIRLLDRSLGSISLEPLPSKSREAFEFVLGETDLVVGAWLAHAGDARR